MPTHSYITKEETGAYEGPLIDGMRPEDYHDNERIMREMKELAERVFGPSQEFLDKQAELLTKRITEDLFKPKSDNDVPKVDRLIDDHLHDLVEKHTIWDEWGSSYDWKALYAVADWYEAKIKELCTS